MSSPLVLTDFSTEPQTTAEPAPEIDREVKREMSPDELEKLLRDAEARGREGALAAVKSAQQATAHQVGDAVNEAIDLFRTAEETHRRHQLALLTTVLSKTLPSLAKTGALREVELELNAAVSTGFTDKMLLRLSDDLGEEAMTRLKDRFADHPIEIQPCADLPELVRLEWPNGSLAFDPSAAAARVIYSLEQELERG
ncbi:MAG: hypothetical protein ACFB0F_05270 [Neomegalonema sp.]